MLDLFCGAGGFSEGFHQAGFEIVAGVDIWVRALQTFKQNHPESKPIYADMRGWRSNGVDVDVVIGGPPCPEFSVAKTNKDLAKGMELVRSFFRIVDELTPDFWCLENVPGAIPHLNPLVRARGGRIHLLNAADYGVPQKRRRMFGTNFSPPIPTHAENASWTLDGKLKKWVTVREAIGLEGKFSVKRSEKGDVTAWQPYYYSDKPAHTVHKTPHRRVMPNFSDTMRNKHPPQTLDSPSRTVRATWSRDQPDNYLEFPSDTILADPRLYTKGTMKDKGTDAEKLVRRLTVRECARLQSFPDSFYFHGSQSDKYVQIGNAVPPLLGKAIAEAIPN